MSDSLFDFEQGPRIIRSLGITESERFLVQLCERTFLDLWSFPNTFRKSGKELCDLLVVCGNDVVVFSEKTIQYPNTGDENVDWQRWVNRAVLKSIAQLRRAESWITKYPDQVYLDASATVRLPVPIPEAHCIRLHRIVIANGAADRCAAKFGGSNGSLLIRSPLAIHGETSLEPRNIPLFTVGDFEPSRSFVHIFDEFNFSIFINELDTVTDFVNYLVQKEKLFRSDVDVWAAGEESLLANYVRFMDSNQQHAFMLDGALIDEASEDLVYFGEGLWEETQAHPQFRAKQEADRISYLWDRLIRQFTRHKLAGTSQELRLGGSDVSEEPHEGGVRYMALEPRVKRRLLACQLMQAFDDAQPDKPLASICGPTRQRSSEENGYVILQFPKTDSFKDYDAYREARWKALYAYAICTAEALPHLKRVIGLAFEPPKYSMGKSTSEDMILFEPGLADETWKDEARELRSTLGIVRKASLKRTSRLRIKEFPDVPEAEMWKYHGEEMPNRRERRKRKAIRRRRK